MKALKNSFSAQPPTAYIYTQAFTSEIKALKRNSKWIGAFVFPYHFSLLPERQAEDEISTGRQAISARGQEKQHISERWWLVSARFVWLGIQLLCGIHLQPLACRTFQDKPLLFELPEQLLHCHHIPFKVALWQDFRRGRSCDLLALCTGLRAAVPEDFLGAGPA